MNCTEIIVQLLYAAGADEDRGDTLVVEEPADGVLRNAQATGISLGLDSTNTLQVLLVDIRAVEENLLRGTATLGDAVEVTVGQQALCQGREAG